jgi:hypothetical protein
MVVVLVEGGARAANDNLASFFVIIFCPLALDVDIWITPACPPYSIAQEIR